MKKTFITLIIALIAISGFSQRLSDSLTSINFYRSTDTLSVQKSQIEKIRNNGYTVSVVLNALSNDHSIPGYINLDPDDYSQFSTSVDMYNWLDKSYNCRYDSIALTYSGTLLDSLKYYIDSTQVYLKTYGNDGTNITTIIP